MRGLRNRLGLRTAHLPRPPVSSLHISPPPQPERTPSPSLVVLFADLERAFRMGRFRSIVPLSLPPHMAQSHRGAHEHLLQLDRWHNTHAMVSLVPSVRASGCRVSGIPELCQPRLTCEVGSDGSDFVANCSTWTTIHAARSCTTQALCFNCGKCIVSHSTLSWLDTAIALHHRQSTGFGFQGCSVRPCSHPRPTCRSGVWRPRQGVTRLCHVSQNELDARLRHAADTLDGPVRTSKRKRCARCWHMRGASAAARAPAGILHPILVSGGSEGAIPHWDLSSPTASTPTSASSSSATDSTSTVSHATSASVAALSARTPQILPSARLDRLGLDMA